MNAAMSTAILTPAATVVFKSISYVKTVHQLLLQDKTKTLKKY